MKPDLKKENELGKLVDLLHHMPQPQPRDLAPNVIDHIKHPPPAGPMTWWQRLGLDFDKQPVLVCVAGVVVCGLLVYGLISSLRVKQPATTADLLQGNSGSIPSGIPNFAETPGSPSAPLLGEVPASTAPAFSPPNKTLPFNPGDRVPSKVGYNTVAGGGGN